MSLLLYYSDLFKKPSKIIDAYDENTKLGQVRESLLLAYKRIELNKKILNSALEHHRNRKREGFKNFTSIKSKGIVVKLNKKPENENFLRLDRQCQAIPRIQANSRMKTQEHSEHLLLLIQSFKQNSLWL